MTDVLLETMTGKEVFSSANAQVNVLVVPSNSTPNLKSEVFLGQATRMQVPVTFHDRGQKINAYATPHRDDLGHWTRAIYKVQEGTILKLFIRRHLGHGRRLIMANQYIRIRDKAALQDLRIALTGDPRARFTTANIKGNFDLISVDEATRLGVKTPPMFRKFFNAPDFNRLVHIDTLRPAVAELPIVKETVKYTEEGDAVVVKTVRRKRTILMD